MKTTIVCTIVAVSACALLISSVEAGGRKGGLGMSSSATSTGAATSSTSYGRSPLGEPVFLIPSSTTNVSGGPIGGFIVNQNPLPPAQRAPNVSAGPFPVGNSTGSGADGNFAKSFVNGGSRGTKVIFTPPPTIVGSPASITGVGNISGANSAVDRVGSEGKFSGSMLDIGLRSATSNASSNQTSAAAQPASAVSVGTGHTATDTTTPVTTAPRTSPTDQSSAAAQPVSAVAVGTGHAAIDTTVPVITSAPTSASVQLGTMPSSAAAGSSAAGGH